MPRGSDKKGHAVREHTADLALAFWAPTEEELLAEGARGVVAQLTEGAAIAPRDTRTVVLRALDPADRLVQWFNEIIFLAVGEGFIAAEADITLEGGGLRATLRGEEKAHDKIKGELKSATYHGLHLGESPPGHWQAQVVIDV